MNKDTVRTLLIVLGILFLLAVLGLGSAVWLFSSSVHVATADEQSAAREFDTVRARFAGVEPVLAMRDGDPVVLRRPSRDVPIVRLSTLRIQHWDPDDESFAQIDLPFWLLRLKSGPIEIGTEVGYSGELDLTVEDLERLGPTLLMDHTGADGDRLLMWTE